MGNGNCCHNMKKDEDRMPDIENLRFEGLDYNRSSSYKQLESIAVEVASQKGLPLYYNSLICRIIAHRQEHLLRVLNDISSVQERQRLLQSLEMVEFEMLDSLYFNYCVGESRKRKKSLLQLEEYDTYDRITRLSEMDGVPNALINMQETNDVLTRDGLEMIRQRKVAVCLLVGGSSERFGGSKCLVDIGLPSHKPVIQLMVERIIKIQMLAMKPIVWNGILDHVHLYVVCNEDNFYAVKQVFLDNNHFGIPNTMVQFFVQPNLPILDDEGHIVLNARNTPELRPAGTGSALGTFLQSNFLTRTLNANIQYIHFIGCENLLAYPLDPIFLSMAQSKQAPVACKSVESSETRQLPYAMLINRQLRVMEREELLNLEDLPVDDYIIDSCDQLLNDVLVNVLFLQAFQKDQHQKNDWQQKYHVVKRTIFGKSVNIFEKYIQDLVELAKTPLIVQCEKIRGYAPLLFNDGKQPLQNPNTNIEQLRLEELSHSMSRQHSISSSTSSKSRKNIFDKDMEPMQTYYLRGSEQGCNKKVSHSTRGDSERYNQSTNWSTMIETKGIKKKNKRSSVEEVPPNLEAFEEQQNLVEKFKEGDRIAAIQQLSFMHKQWMKLKFASQAHEILEVSPLVSYQGEGLQKYQTSGIKQRFDFPRHIYEV